MRWLPYPEGTPPPIPVQFVVPNFGAGNALIHLGPDVAVDCADCAGEGDRCDKVGEAFHVGDEPKAVAFMHRRPPLSRRSGSPRGRWRASRARIPGPPLQVSLHA